MYKNKIDPAIVYSTFFLAQEYRLNSKFICIIFELQHVLMGVYFLGNVMVRPIMVVRILGIKQVLIIVQRNWIMLATTKIGKPVMKAAQYMSMTMIGNFRIFLNFILSFRQFRPVLKQHQQVFHMKIAP